MLHIRDAREHNLKGVDVEKREDIRSTPNTRVSTTTSGTEPGLCKWVFAQAASGAGTPV